MQMINVQAYRVEPESSPGHPGLQTPETFDLDCTQGQRIGRLDLSERMDHSSLSSIVQSPFYLNQL